MRPRACGAAWSGCAGRHRGGPRGLPPGAIPLPGNIAVTRAPLLRGAFRFDIGLDESIGVLARGPPVEAIVTHTFSLAESRAAFDTAHDRTIASKVLLDLRTPV
ncbi:hypothetical protein G3M58_17300 [Streptomyces sp. SID7499]|uniref:Zinc-binding dehydrogenase n=1 Tax=Streptomyces sp. SID7499 TaxID=2706086 RepID=A0A6G3WRR3_9ACTN|nr:hypothetical protein [Streptomyces sp. SID7499]